MRRHAALALCALLLAGCSPAAREPDDLALVRVLGVDGGSPVVMAAVCAREGEEPAWSGWVEAESFEQARRALPWSGGTEELSLAGVSHLLVGPGVDLEKLLFAVLEDAELGAASAVWATDQNCAVVLAVCTDPAADLELLTLQGVAAPTVAQAVAALVSEGEVTLPCLGVRAGRLEERGERRWETEE